MSKIICLLEIRLKNLLCFFFKLSCLLVSIYLQSHKSHLNPSSHKLSSYELAHYLGDHLRTASTVSNLKPMCQTKQSWINSGASYLVIICKLGKQTIVGEFTSHLVSHASGLVLNLNLINYYLYRMWFYAR